MSKRLSEYRHKRDFRQSPEPSGQRSGKGRGGRRMFVVQLHHASHRHFDFRLEYGGTLRSWAVPKGPSLDPAQKRLAVEVEDHPISYASFEGDIPEGHYGAGHVDVWDEGSWIADEDELSLETQFKKGHLHFELQGFRLKGRWSLVRTRFKGRQPQWLLIKGDDEHVQRGDVADDTSLRQWRKLARSSKEAAHTPARRVLTRRKVKKTAVGKAAAFPKQVGLQLARLSDHAPAGDDWDHEVKYDGYRILIFRNGKQIRISSRNGQDYSASIPGIAEALRQLGCRQCVLDAELIATDAQGRSNFDLLQQHFNEGGAMQVVAFDLLYLDGCDLRSLSLRERRATLDQLLDAAPAPLSLSTHISGSGAQAFRHACEHGLEGIISKSREAPYHEGRHGEWLKIKCTQSDEYVIVGYTEGQGSRERLGSLLLAKPGKGRGQSWRYAGRVGSGFTETHIGDLLKQLKTAKEPVALDHPPTRSDLKGAQVTWVRPGIVAEVVYRAITRDGLLRQATLKGIRRDKSAKDIQRPDAPAPVPASSRRSGKARSAGDKAMKETLFTHPERIIFDKPRITKAQLGGFYSDIADQILPELRGRPLSLMRCPDGVTKACFFQKHRTPGLAGSVHEAQLKKDRQKYLYIDDLDGLLALVQMNVVEFHPWGASVDDEEHPDRLVLDLDPGPHVPWTRVVAAARQLREMLKDLKLTSFVRTSGGKGLHVVIPLEPQADWGTAKEFTHALARTLAQQDPEHFIDVATKAQRTGRIFVDYLRNARGATSVASYSLRARPGAPIAMPLAWNDLPRLKSGDHFTYANARRHLKARKCDPWADIGDVHQTLPHLS